MLMETSGVTVITGDDTPIPYNIAHHLPTEHPLANGRVRYYGEGVAAVAAVDEKTADKAVDLIEVEYEVLPAVFDDLEAARRHARAQRRGCVIKADGLAAGKGVAMCETVEAAEADLPKTSPPTASGRHSSETTTSTSANSTAAKATLTAPVEMRVSVRTRLPARKAPWKARNSPGPGSW